ncbi:MAG: GNAT family N-acetyltransferase [Alkalinema sp. RU_4_3]|nr:GNAT family N-acetyltransferase [Alkalinema sp. RU_4_3]
MDSNYAIKPGGPIDRARLVKFMHRTYQEIFPGGDFSHLAQTVENHLSRDTPLWWAFLPGETMPVAGLWMGTAIDQVRGDRYSHIFLLYVEPDHRRRGLATKLMAAAEAWARARGDRQLGLQVFLVNGGAIALYESLGFGVQSISMVKEI